MNNKNKVINDPLYGFIRLPNALIYGLINHPFFQRLRRIKQLGLSDLVYPGAVHTRFHHALGAMHLAGLAVDSLRLKGVEISKEEKQGLQIALLLHDIGHGPFSHTLEKTLLKGMHHEALSLGMMHVLNNEFANELKLGIKMFCNTYERRFFHQLVASQLDLDRLDYLKRDAFHTGVIEGSVGADHILKMIQVKDNELVIEEKGIYSIENFLSSRRLMYWQVYMHKTAVSAEKMLIKIISRAKALAADGVEIMGNCALKPFILNNYKKRDFDENQQLYYDFAKLDDSDILFALKQWTNHQDFILSYLCQSLLDRRLFRIQISTFKTEEHQLSHIKERIRSKFPLSTTDSSYFLDAGELKNYGYQSQGNQINLLTKGGIIKDIAEAADLPNIQAMREVVRKYYLCWPKNLA